MPVFDNVAFDDHEQVHFFRDPETGLRAIVAIHSTALGPAAGGCRMWPYESYDEALFDVLRLSKAMSYKNAMAGLPLGGGKAVIIADPHTEKDDKLLAAFGRFVQGLNGRYWTAEDVGMGLGDVEVIGGHCDFVFGVSSRGVATGDPSPATALGVFQGLRAAVRYRLGREDLAGLRVAVQGVGSVGRKLCGHLHRDGAQLFATDVNEEAVEEAVGALGATSVEPDSIYEQEVDVLSPCAMGGVINDETIPLLKAKVIAGAANNQLLSPRHGRDLKDRGILYAPDYVINAGGMLSGSGDILQRHDPDVLKEKVMALYDTVTHIFEVADTEDRPTNEIADEMARHKIAAASAR